MQTKKIFFSVALTLSLSATMSLNANVILNSDNFPDANFRAYLTSVTGVAENGSIDNGSITSIDCSNKNIKTLKGINNFYFLSTLKCNGNQLTSIDLSGNGALTNVNLDNNNLNSINLSKFYTQGLTALSMSNNGRTIKVYSYERGSGYTGTDKIGYYVPLNDQNSTISGLATLIYNARNSDFDSQEPVSGAFDIAKVVAGSWEGATLGTFNGTDVLFLDKTTVGANANLHRFTYVYSTGINIGGSPVSVKGKSPSALKVSSVSPTVKFYLDWSEEQVVSSVNNVAGETAKVYSINGIIHVVGAMSKVNVYNVGGQQVYCGTNSEIAVPAGMYVVKVDGTACKVLVR
jgi:hypothetical protein